MGETIKYKVDVLVIGAGAAGYHAAIEARKLGADVLLVNKPGGNATIMAAGGFAGNFNQYNEKKDEQMNEVFSKDILKSGRYINNLELVKKLVENSYQELVELKNQNIDFIVNETGDFKLFKASGHTYPRTVRCLKGNTLQYYSSIRVQALKLGVKIINSTTIIELDKKENKIYGAVGICGNKTVFISCPSIIIATGGFSANYNNSTHSKSIQGLGLSMALKAGVELIDMEFVQFMPTVIAYPKELKGMIITDTLRGEGAILLNGNLERFMEKYSPENKEMETRDRISRFIFQEIYEKRATKNNAVYLDARHIDREVIKNSFTNYELLMKKGIDPKKKLIEVSPAAHYTCGGIKVDDNSFTGVKGLWAVGEVTGGLHGANRLGSIALTENIVFGKTSGKNAALYSLKNPITSENNKLKDEKLVKSENTVEIKEIEEKLRKVISDTAGIVKNETDLIEGMEKVEDIMSDLSEIENQSIYNLKLIELKSFALINYCIIKSSIKRKESRGTHFRLDYPEEREDLARTINISQKDDRILHYYEDSTLKKG